MVQLRHEEKTGILRGLVFKVRNELKGGWSEEVYHQALAYALEEEGIPFVSKPRRPFLHRCVEIHLFEPDFIIWDAIVAELKVMPYQKTFLGKHFAQIYHYLKFWQKDLGLLINFGPSRVKIERVLWDETDFEVEEDYDRIKSHLSKQDKKMLRQIRHHILSLANQYGLGYPETMYRKLLAAELAYHQIPCVSDIGIRAKWNGRNLPRHSTHHLCVADNYLVHIRSFLESPTTYDFISTKTYLAALGFQFGLIVNFGRDQLQIHSVKINK